ncbi:MAG: hypothetical protein LCH93_07080 [Proteobacteria bacterium]|nr:hypothetical protein [Pseudomonadota bacterium]
MYEVKVFIVQKANGELVGAKLTRGAAQSVARYHAPAKITVVMADKTSLGGCLGLDARADHDDGAQ